MPSDLAPESALEAARAKAAGLRDCIRWHEYQYYVEDDPKISDGEFDRLMRELQEVEVRFPDLVTEDSPTRRVGGAPREAVEKGIHSSSLLSLDNAFNEGELRDFDRRARELAGVESLDYVGELKFDGVSMALHYGSGRLELALTRGDGQQGEVITPNARTLRSVPLAVKTGALDEAGLPADFEVRGEVVMPRASFERLNRERREAKLAMFANPRNVAAGTLRMLDQRVTYGRRLDFFAYALLVDGADFFPTHWEALQALRALGFKVDRHSERLSGIEELLRFRDERMALRAGLAYEIDGLVFKLDQARLRRALGSTSKAPRWAIACKPEAQQVETVVEGIDVQVGRTGAITPRAILLPVEVGGVTVSRATLHNEDEIARLGLQIGDVVLLERSGDVIPKIVRVVREGEGRRPFEMPATCPSCDSQVVRPGGEVVARCANASCKARLKQSIQHFVHRSAMDIDGIGERLVEQLVDRGRVKDISDLYKLQVEDLAALKKDSPLTPAKSESVVAAIGAARRATWGTLVSALAIPAVGPTTARAMADRFPGRTVLESADAAEIAAIKGVTARAAKSVVRFLNSGAGRSLLDQLTAAGLRCLRPAGKGRELELALSLPQQSPPTADEATALRRATGTFVRRMEIKGMGDLLIGELVEAGLLRSQADLFSLCADDLQGRGSVRLGAKSARKILESIKGSKQAPLSSLLFGLGIRFVGDRTAALLAARFGSLDAVAAASEEELIEVEEVGPNIARAIREFFGSRNNREVIERLRKSGLRLEEQAPAIESRLPFEGKVFVITGALSEMTRTEARAVIERLGGKVTGSVSSKTDFLLHGSKAGSKLAKARKLGVVELGDTRALRELAGDAWPDGMPLG